MKSSFFTKIADFYKLILISKGKYLNKNTTFLLLLIIVFILIYGIFIRDNTYSSTDVIIEKGGKVLNQKTKKQVLNGKILFKKDGNIDIEYATISNGYVDTRFSKYLNGNPKREYRITYEGNKDTKNEYFKEWYENGVQKTFLQYQKIQEWYENSVMSMECLNYQIDDFQSYITTHTIVDDFPQLADDKTVEKNGNCKEWNEKGLLLKETQFDKQKVDIKSVEYFYTDSGSLDKKISYEKSTKIEEGFYPSGKQRNKLTSDLQEEWYEDGDIKRIVEKNGSGTTFYQGGTIKEHTEEKNFYKKGYFQNGTIQYEYRGQIGKTYDIQGNIVEECKVMSISKTYRTEELGVLFGSRMVEKKKMVDVIQCFDDNGNYLYQAPDEQWKNIPQK